VLLVPSGLTGGLAVWPLLYVGPDQILPLTSVLGAIVGVLLMFWNRVVGVFVRFKNFLSRR
jgi:hypothetical protein